MDMIIGVIFIILGILGYQVLKITLSLKKDSKTELELKRMRTFFNYMEILGVSEETANETFEEISKQKLPSINKKLKKLIKKYKLSLPQSPQNQDVHQTLF